MFIHKRPLTRARQERGNESSEANKRHKHTTVPYSEQACLKSKFTITGMIDAHRAGQRK